MVIAHNMWVTFKHSVFQVRLFCLVNLIPIIQYFKMSFFLSNIGQYLSISHLFNVSFFQDPPPPPCAQCFVLLGFYGESYFLRQEKQYETLQPLSEKARTLTCLWYRYMYLIFRLFSYSKVIHKATGVINLADTFWHGSMTYSFLAETEEETPHPSQLHM